MEEPRRDPASPHESNSQEKQKNRYLLRLYVTGLTARSARAISNIKRVCEEELRDNYDLEVIDIYQQPALAAGQRIVATPTLIKELPAPVRRLIGDLSDHEKVLFGLDIRRPLAGN
jgi:circadian clock protein KaiB